MSWKKRLLDKAAEKAEKLGKKVGEAANKAAGEVERALNDEKTKEAFSEIIGTTEKIVKSIDNAVQEGIKNAEQGKKTIKEAAEEGLINTPFTEPEDAVEFDVGETVKEIWQAIEQGALDTAEQKVQQLNEYIEENSDALKGFDLAPYMHAFWKRVETIATGVANGENPEASEEISMHQASFMEFLGNNGATIENSDLNKAIDVYIAIQKAGESEAAVDFIGILESAEEEGLDINTIDLEKLQNAAVEFTLAGNGDAAKTTIDLTNWIKEQQAAPKEGLSPLEQSENELKEAVDDAFSEGGLADKLIDLFEEVTEEIVGQENVDIDKLANETLEKITPQGSEKVGTANYDCLKAVDLCKTHLADSELASKSAQSIAAAFSKAAKKGQTLAVKQKNVNTYPVFLVDQEKGDFFSETPEIVNTLRSKFDDAKAYEWFTNDNADLGGKPADYMATEAGRAKVASAAKKTI